MGKRRPEEGHPGVKKYPSKLQYASAWTYCFIRHQWERPIKNRNPFLKKAESRLRRRLRREKCVDSWKNTKRYWQIRLLTAFLVGNVYANEQKRHGLKDPLANFAKFHADSFYRTYIQPRLKHVESLVQKKAHATRLSFQRIPEKSFRPSKLLGRRSRLLNNLSGTF